jgi:ABC-type branched-chain amino acid transport systems, periplasmic component
MRFYRLLVWLLLSLNLLGCSPDYANMAEQRLEYARQNQGDIHIVAFRDTYKSNYLNGVLLAAETINQRPGKLLGRTLVVNIEQDQASFEETKPTIRRIAANPKVTAVLGHRASSLSIPASAIYESSQIIFIPPFATAQGLTGYNFQYVFRMSPKGEIIAEQLASVAEQLGYKNIVTLYERNDISRELAFLFEDAAVKRGIKLVQNSSFFEGEDNYRPLISQFTSKDFDAVFVSSPPQPGGKMVKQLREMGVNKPILGNDSFNLPAYANAAGAAGKNTIVPAIYQPNNKNPYNTAFIQRYQAKYQEDPDYNAAQGYDSVMLLATGIEKAGATIPALLSSTMHYIPAWLGATGLHAYDAYGDLYGKHYVFNVWQQGEFRPLPAIHVPFLLSRFEQRLSTTTDKNSQTNQQTMGKTAADKPEQSNTTTAPPPDTDIIRDTKNSRNFYKVISAPAFCRNISYTDAP